ncbi:MAG TPA: TraB/GumN family protein [Rhodanobacteraceae bacterium]|nr:TraB/GumN family protein [Rhodanobacteraceae bacterium]
MPTPSRLLAFFAATFIALAAGAQTPNEPQPASELPAVVVTGEQPGPGLWKVSKGDHVLWILGTLSPLPKNMTWRAKDVEDVIAQAQAVLNPPRIDVKADVGFWGKLRLLPSLIAVRDNPGHKTLQDVLPPDLYARWMTLKDKYIGRGRGRNIETWRPIFAALELYNAAIKETGLTRSDVASDVVREAAKRANIEPTSSTVKMKVEDPHAAVKEFKGGSMDDLDCFRKTLDHIEADLGTMTARANAWATGDIETLRKMPYTDLRETCLAAVADTQLAHELGFSNIDERVQDAWLDTAAAALDKNAVTFARLPMSELLRPDGYLAKLQARGYSVEAPDAEDATP